MDYVKREVSHIVAPEPENISAPDKLSADTLDGLYINAPSNGSGMLSRNMRSNASRIEKDPTPARLFAEKAVLVLELLARVKPTITIGRPPKLSKTEIGKGFGISRVQESNCRGATKNIHNSLIVDHMA